MFYRTMITLFLRSLGSFTGFFGMSFLGFSWALATAFDSSTLGATGSEDGFETSAELIFGKIDFDLILIIKRILSLLNIKYKN